LLDIALADDGGFIVFDPNFRFNTPSTQVLLHEAAAARDGLAASCSAHAATLLPFETIRRRIEGADRRRLVRADAAPRRPLAVDC
jgi:hypothetical protein